MSFLNYLFQVSGCILAFYAVYYSLFRKETFSQFNRGYLLFGAIVSLLLPVIPQFIPISSVPEWAAKNIEQPANLIEVIPMNTARTPFTAVKTPIENTECIVNSTAPTFQFNDILKLIYILGAVFMLLKLILNISKIVWQIRTNEVIKKEGFYLVKSQQKLVCSFFNYIFWNENLTFTSSEKEQIFSHEIAHIKERHTLDVLFLELLTVLLWFNPLIYFYKKSLKSVHEYIADHYVFHQLNYKSNYAKLLIKEASHNIAPLFVVNTFFNSLTKKRLIMLTQKTSKLRRLKSLAVLPTFCLLLLTFCIQSSTIAETVEKRYITYLPQVEKSTPIDTENLAVPSNKKQSVTKNEVINTSKKDSIKPKNKDTSLPEMIKEVEKGENLWKTPKVLFALKGRPMIQIDGNLKALFRADGSRKSLAELRKELTAKSRAKGYDVTEADVFIYTNNQLKEWGQIDLESFKEVEEFITGGIKFTWTGINNGQINDLSDPKHQSFQLWDYVGKQNANIEEYSIIIARNGKKLAYSYSFTFPRNGNKFPANVFEQLKQLQTGDEVTFFDFKYKSKGKMTLSRDKIKFVVE